MNRFTPCVLWIVMMVVFLPVPAESQDTYSFQQMWPTLKQPWYFFSLTDIASDDKGNIYISDLLNDRIQKFSPDGTFITTWGKTGSDPGEFDFPTGIDVGPLGYVYVVERWNRRIQKFSPDGSYVPTAWDVNFGPFLSGIAADAEGHIYVTESWNNLIYKFSTDGGLPLVTWSLAWNPDNGDSNAWPQGIAAAAEGNIYVADANNNRIHKFDAQGGFDTCWGEGCEISAQFNQPEGITTATDGEGTIFVYVADYGNNRVQKFDADGLYHSTIVLEAQPKNSTVISEGYIYVVDEVSIHKFSPEGVPMARWGSSSQNEGKFNNPQGIATDAAGNVYVADSFNDRIQMFTPGGTYITGWGEYGTDDGQFRLPVGVAVDSAGNLYVADSYNDRIQRRSPDGVWESLNEPGQFDRPEGVAVDNAGNVYVADTYNNQFQWRSPEGVWESLGEPGQFDLPKDVAVDSAGNLYVTDSHNDQIQRRSPDGVWTVWGDSAFSSPVGIAVDAEDTIYVVDRDNNRIQKLNSGGTVTATWGEFGSWPGKMSYPTYLAVGPGGGIYVADTGNDRVQLFKNIIVESNNRAIIVAGRASSGDSLWNSTQMCTNFAYRTLIHQGFDKSSIYYLTADTDLDLDGNRKFDASGLSDDIRGAPTTALLFEALTGWAAGADDVVLYLADHGQVGTFTMSESETLSVGDLALGLNTLQQNITGTLTVVYDACESGTFLDELAADGRIIITSTLPGERAKFLANGTISFSYAFWTNVFNGFSTYDAFTSAAQFINFTFENQNPRLSGNAESHYIGNALPDMIGEIPEIGSVPLHLDIGDEVSATLFAENVTDPDGDGIERVWAEIWPPGTSLGSTEIPLLDQLPRIELMPVGDTARYRGTYNNFAIPGIYQIFTYAIDGQGNTSLPKMTQVYHNYSFSGKAIIVAGRESGNLTPAMINTTAGLAFEALLDQGYIYDEDNESSDDIYFMSDNTSQKGVEEAPSPSHLQNYLSRLANDPDIKNLDLVIYLIGAGDTGIFIMNDSPSDILDASRQLKVWLDNLQTRKPGTRVTLIYDGDRSGSFVSLLAPPDEGMERILITSAGENDSAYFSEAGNVSFSTFFWTQVAAGNTVDGAFVTAANSISYLNFKNEISFSCDRQIPLIDANGNGVGNEPADYQIARGLSIGIGTRFAAGAPPYIGWADVEETGGRIRISAGDITHHTPLKRVWGVIKPMAYCPGDAAEGTIGPVEIELSEDPGEEGTYEGQCCSCHIKSYKVIVYARDEDDNTSLPREIKKILQTDDQDIYEVDDYPAQAQPVVVNHSIPQPHNLHHVNDWDWVTFYGFTDYTYRIKADNLGINCKPRIEVYYQEDYPDGPLEYRTENAFIDNGSVSIDFDPLQDGVYYVKVFWNEDEVYLEGENSYELRVDNNDAGGLLTLIYGSVTDKFSRIGIDGAIIETTDGGGSAISVGGAYEFFLKAGSWWLEARAPAQGYDSPPRELIIVEEGEPSVVKDIVMEPADILECTQASDCIDGLFCNGEEACTGGKCASGTAPCSDDGLFCTGEETCDEGQRIVV